MTTIQVLGIGCRRCVALKENAEKALESLGIEADVQKIEDVNERGGLPPHDFKTGDTVRLTGGPLDGFDAIFQG